MRPSEPALLLVAALSAGCAIPLEGSSDPAAAATPSKPPQPAVAPGCRLFDGAATGLSGPGRSIAQGDGWLWIFDGATLATGSFAVPSATVPAGVPPASPGCFAGTSLTELAVDTTALGPTRFAVALDGAHAGGVDVLYLQVSEPAAGQPFGVRAVGVAVATRADASQPYVAAGFLWTADRPTFGTSVLVEGGFLYAYGCTTSGLRSVCDLARVAEDQVTDLAAYRYADGGGHFLADLEQAAPLVVAGPSLSVRHDLAHDRYLMSDVPPLGGDLELRTGLGPAGPWSDPVEVARCEVPADDGGAFCTGAVQHPEAAPPGEIALSYGIASLSSDAAARVTAAPSRYWSRLVTMAWPESLP